MEISKLPITYLFSATLATSVTALPVGEPLAEVTSALHPLVTRVANTELLALKPSKVEEEEITDRYLFNLTLNSFISERNRQNPSFLFWESDGCSDSPDHPFGFDYLPACYRHDFGYDQYRRVCIVTNSELFQPTQLKKMDRFLLVKQFLCSTINFNVFQQGRFTIENKAKVDLNFKEE